MGGSDATSGASSEANLDSAPSRAANALTRWFHAQFFRLEHRADQRFDQRAGIQTLGTVHLDDLTIDSENTDFGEDETIYVGIPTLALRDLAKRLPDDLRAYTFVDYGSGKGRVVCWAATLPFRRVVGVEFAAELHAAAASNVSNFQHPDRACDDVEVLHADATEFQLPGGPCVLYFFNPFEEPVLTRVAAEIARSHAADPRPIHIWYHNPRYAEVFRSLDGFEEVWSRTSSRRSECYEAAFFRSTPTAAHPSELP